MSDLVSKMLAGGLSAGIFLLWWPAHVTADGPEWLIVRGLLWTLAFEILLVSFCPLERTIRRTLHGRRRAQPASARGALGATLAAATGIALPLALLHGVRPPAEPPAARAGVVTKRVVVERPVVRRQVIVRHVRHEVRVPAATTPRPAITRARPRPRPAARPTRPVARDGSTERTAPAPGAPSPAAATTPSASASKAVTPAPPGDTPVPATSATDAAPTS